MADELTAEAKAEIADAVRTVRQDKMDKFLRSHPLLNPKANEPAPKPDPKNSPPKPGDPPSDPPPPKPDDPPADPPPKPGRGLWWSGNE